MTTRPEWLDLLTPLPNDAIPERQPVAPPGILATPEGASIAGWQQIVLHLSEPSVGLRTVLVVVDASGAVLSAGDSTYERISDEPSIVRHASIGGRFESDGTFIGTCWRSEGPEPPEHAPSHLPWTRTMPTDAETAGLRALVAEMLRRRPR